jgi:hypothetical protein
LELVFACMLGFETICKLLMLLLATLVRGWE